MPLLAEEADGAERKMGYRGSGLTGGLGVAGGSLSTDVRNEVRMGRPQTSQEEGIPMTHCEALDLSVKETATCIVDEAAKIVREHNVAREAAEAIEELAARGLE